MSNLEQYIETRLKELESLEKNASDYKEMNLYSQLYAEVRKMHLLLRKDQTSAISIKELPDGKWDATIGDFQFSIKRVLNESLYELFLINKDDSKYMCQIAGPENGAFRSLQDALDKIRDLYQDGITN